MNKDKLRKLGNHLIESKELNVGKFNYKVYYRADADCGSCGCALGEACYLFPDELMLKENETGWDVCWREADEVINFEAAAKVFDISAREAEFLFSPYTNGLSLYATKKEVGEHILKFIGDEVTTDIVEN